MYVYLLQEPTQPSPPPPPRKFSIPLGSCVGIESGIVETSAEKPSNLCQELHIYLTGQNASLPRPPGKIAHTALCSALLRTLDTTAAASADNLLTPPLCVTRAAGILQQRKDLTLSSLISWLNRRKHPSPLLALRLAQTILLSLGDEQKRHFVYPLALAFAARGYPVSCLLAAAAEVGNHAHLDMVYQFIVAGEVATLPPNFVQALRERGWLQPPLAGVKELVSLLIDGVIKTKEEGSSLALRLILTARGFADLDGPKTAYQRFGVIGWLKVRLLPWITSLTKR